MSMPLDLYVIRHGESEANVIVQAGEQGDNSLYTQDNVTVPDRSWISCSRNGIREAPRETIWRGETSM